MAETDIIKVVTDAFWSDNFVDFNVEIENSNSKALHIGANMVFVKVKSTDHNGKSETQYLAVKMGKVPIPPNVHAEDIRESYVYNNILPLFTNLLKERNIRDHSLNFPKCFKILNYNGYETLIMENLKSRRYEMVRGKTVSDHSHNTIVKTLAQFHAVSFALQDLRGEEFDKIIKNCRMPNGIFISVLTDAFYSVLEKIKRNLENSQKPKLLKTFMKLLESCNDNTFLELLNDVPERKVLVHGDYHKFNMMFRYETEDTEDATDVTLMDFQEAGLHSPMLDLSYYFYSLGALGLNDLSKLDDCLKYYHEELSTFLSQLGCNVENIFPFSTLLNHWRKYSFYGFTFMAALIVFRFTDTTEFISKYNLDKNVSRVNEEKDIAMMFKDILVNCKIDRIEEYNEALLKFAEDYLNYGVDV